MNWKNVALSIYLAASLAACQPIESSSAPPSTAVSTPSPPPATTPAPPTATMPSPVLLEKSAQSFEPRTTSKIGLGDLDGDGDLDAVFANMGFNYSQEFLNDGNGYFIDTGQELTQQGHGVALGDLDNDSDLDIIISCASFTENGVVHNLPNKVYFNAGDGSFYDSGQDFGDTELSGTSIDLFDLDGDGDLDALATYYLSPNKVFLNDGSGHFSDPGKTFPDESTWADLDGDGDIDMFVKDLAYGYKTLLNDGFGNFSEYWQMADPNVLYGGVLLEDIDMDGDPDAIIGNGDNIDSNPTIILLNDGSGHFIDSGQQLNNTKWASFGLVDLNGDGFLDIFVSNFLQPNQVWVNDGSGQFTNSEIDLGGNSGTIRVSVGDLDGDGDQDIFLPNFTDGQNEIWFNLSP